jgi:hypothetical protein
MGLFSFLYGNYLVVFGTSFLVEKNGFIFNFEFDEFGEDDLIDFLLIEFPGD